jgi:4-hydroxybenzoate polyprenyltransferase
MTQEPSINVPVSDAVARHWADRLLPVGVRPFARLARIERPIGWWLLLLPGWWSIALAQSTIGGGLPDLRLLALFLVGAIVMRGAGCTLNDIVDRDIDAMVARTRSRPLPSGQLSLAQAAAFLAALLALGLLVLLALNPPTILLGAASLLLVAIYPFMKRVTHWPQLFLGLAFNWGALLGWCAVKGAVELPALLLYAGGIFWTLAYDTLYAHQDKDDDALVGVKSTALLFGPATGRWLAAFFAVSIVLLAAAGTTAGAGFPYLFALLAAAVHATWQLHRLDINDPDTCLMLFRSNRDFGLILFAGAAAASIATGGLSS